MLCAGRLCTSARPAREWAFQNCGRQHSLKGCATGSTRFQPVQLFHFRIWCETWVSGVPKRIRKDSATSLCIALSGPRRTWSLPRARGWGPRAQSGRSSSRSNTRSLGTLLSGHFYFAQTGHSHFAATQAMAGLALRRRHAIRDHLAAVPTSGLSLTWPFSLKARASWLLPLVRCAQHEAQ